MQKIKKQQQQQLRCVDKVKVNVIRIDLVSNREMSECDFEKKKENVHL